MKNKVLPIQLLLFLGIYANGQVGIGQSNPTRTLHNTGDLRVRDLRDKLSDSTYDRVLVVDKNGNIDYSTIAALIPDDLPPTDPKNVVNNYYGTENELPVDSEIITCGKFQFAFIQAQKSKIADVRFRLKNAPTENIEVYTTFEQNYAGSKPDNGGFQFEASSTPRTLTPSNPFISVPNDELQARIANGEYNELYISYPRDPEFYRASFYKVTQDKKTRWIVTCEQF